MIFQNLQVPAADHHRPLLAASKRVGQLPGAEQRQQCGMVGQYAQHAAFGRNLRLFGRLLNQDPLWSRNLKLKRVSHRV